MSSASSLSKLKRASSISAMHLRPKTDIKRLKQERGQDLDVQGDLAEEFCSCVEGLFSLNVIDTLRSLQQQGGDIERQAAAMELSFTKLRNYLKEDLRLDKIVEEGLNIPFNPPLILTELPFGTSALLTRLEELRTLVTGDYHFPPPPATSPISLQLLDDDPERTLLPVSSASSQLSLDDDPGPNLLTATSASSPQRLDDDLGQASIVPSIVPILLRPNGKDGPSIRTLDPAFCLFSVIVSSAPPAEKERTQDYISAERVALILHGTMGEIYFDDSDDPNHSNGTCSTTFSFNNPSTISVPRPLNAICIPSDFQHADTNKRRVAFMYALDGFLPLQCQQDAVILANHEEGRFDVLFSDNRSYYLAVRVDIETPVGVNPDMQLSCMYDLFRRSLSQHVLPGCPMFLMAIVGPRIAIFGAIHDGASTIVEPLVSCIAVRDPFHLLVAPLAQAFHALKQAILNLQSRSQTGSLAISRSKIVPGCPAIFTHFVFQYPRQETREFTVEYLRPFDIHGRQSSHIFEAIQEDVQGDSILVKFPIMNKYGLHVHMKLADLGFAPKLLGWCITPVGTAYAMEHLKKPTDSEGGWLTLYDLACGCIAEAQRLHAGIRNCLQDILDTLQRNNMVHGDIRSNNIMVKMKDLLHVEDHPRPLLMIVDLDWADYELSAYYPAFINTDIPWPGKPGAQILSSHDVEMVDKWWTTYPTSIPF